MSDFAWWAIAGVLWGVLIAGILWYWCRREEVDDE